MIRRFIENEKGAVLPFVALFLFFVGFGMIALVVDAGTLYNTRRSMVTAADAGALAGAMEMENSLGVTDIDDINDIKVDAINIARSFALENGAESVDVQFKQIPVTLSDGNVETREVIEVTVVKNEEHDFAKIIGFNDSDVAAQAAATWGYSKQIMGGQIFPLFMTLESYENGDTLLHQNLVLEDGTVSPPNYSLIALSDDTNVKDIKVILSGTNIDEQFIIEQIMTSQTGNVQAIIGSIETRMEKALTLETEEERKSFMSGLIPIVETEVVVPEIEDNSTAHINVRVKYFAIYTIYDVIVSEGNNNNKDAKGSAHALTTTDFTKVSEPQIYESNYPKGTILGEFSGETIELNSVITDGDQDALPENEGLATYSKLVK